MKNLTDNTTKRHLIWCNPSQCILPWKMKLWITYHCHWLNKHIDDFFSSSVCCINIMHFIYTSFIAGWLGNIFHNSIGPNFGWVNFCHKRKIGCYICYSPIMILNKNWTEVARSTWWVRLYSQIPTSQRMTTCAFLHRENK